MMPQRPEHRLLAACAAARTGADRRAEIYALIGSGLDWQLVLAASRVHRVVALCYPVLRQLGPAAVPAQVLEAFRAKAMAVAARNLRLASRLLEITERAKAAGIALIPYKGPVLAEMAYGDLALREFADLDFVLPHRELRAAWELIEGLDYRAGNPSLAAPAAPVPGEYVFLAPENGTRIELHTELTLRHFPSPPDLKPMIASRLTINLLSRPVQTFSREDTLTLLAVHGAKDFWAQLLWICDVARLIEMPGFDWEKALEQTELLGCRRMTNVALLLAREALGVTFPENVLQTAAADVRAGELVHWLAGRLFEAQPLGRMEQMRYRMGMVEGFWPGLGYFARLATTPAAEDWDVVRLPASFAFVYALLRPLRLFRR